MPRGDRCLRARDCNDSVLVPNSLLDIEICSLFGASGLGCMRGFGVGGGGGWLHVCVYVCWRVGAREGAGTTWELLLVHMLICFGHEMSAKRTLLVIWATESSFASEAL